MSKGDNRRPAQVSEDQILKNWEKIFGKKSDKSKKKSKNDDDNRRNR